MGFQLTTSATPFQAGVTGIVGQGDTWQYTFGGNWNTGDEYTVILTNTLTSAQVQLGAGNLTGQNPNYVLTFSNKEYLLSGPTVYASALASPTVYNDPNAIGDGFITLSDWFSTPENLVAAAVYQGRLAFFARSVVQIWTTNSNLALWVQNQVLQNIGTFAPLSVQSYGDLDVYFLADSGVRSLRVRDSSLNAYVDDIGSPVDQLIQTQLATLTATELAQCSAVVEPTSNRYMLFVPNHSASPNVGQYYVLSYFKSSKVAAWSTYQPTWNNSGTQTYFQPQNHVVYQGQVYTRDTTALYSFNGQNTTLDNCVVTIISPYYDLKKPVTKKKAKMLDIVATGDFTTAPSSPCTWAISASVDPISGIYAQVVNPGSATAANNVNPTSPANVATVDSGEFPYSDRGTHFSFKAVSSGTGQAVFSEIIYTYEDEGVKP